MKKIRVERDDIHAKLMRNYPEVPEWWYISAFCFFFCVAVITVEVGFSVSILLTIWFGWLILYFIVIFLS